MKNISMIMNVVLLAAVAFLGYKAYSGNGNETMPGTAVNNNSNLKIAYVNNDTLYDNYELYKKINTKFEERKDSIDTYLRSRSSQLEKEVMKYQQEASNMSDNQRMAREKQLTSMQEGLVKMRNNILDQLGVEEKQLADSIHDKISDYVKKYSRKNGYTFILGYQRGSIIHYADTTLDVTQEVLTGLNKEQ